MQVSLLIRKEQIDPPTCASDWTKMSVYARIAPAMTAKPYAIMYVIIIKLHIQRFPCPWCCIGGRGLRATCMCYSPVYRIAKYHLNPYHYSDVIMSAMASQTTSLAIVCSTFIQAQIKKNIKALRHWPLCGEFTGDRWIPRTNGQ